MPKGPDFRPPHETQIDVSVLSQISKVVPYLLTIDTIDPPTPIEFSEVRIKFTLVNQTSTPCSGVLLSAYGGKYEINNLGSGEVLSDFVVTRPPPAGEGRSLLLQFFKKASPGEEFPPLLCEADATVDVAATFRISLDSLHIFTTRALDEDTDYVALSAQVGQRDPTQTGMALGDVDNGDHKIELNVGPFAIVPGRSEDLTFVYAVVNRGYDSTAKDAMDQLMKVVTPLLSKLIPWVGGVVAEGLKTVFGWIFANCDGTVVEDRVTFGSQTLDELTRATGLHSETRRYPGTNSPMGCGDNSDYSLTWTLSRPSAAVSHHTR